MAFSFTRKSLIRGANAQPYVLSKNAVSYAVTLDCVALSMSRDTTKVRNSLLYVFKKFGSKWKVVQAAGSLASTEESEFTDE